ncbi:MAG: hypothetical protein FWE45_02305 [Firmicutes bacterium]|nr:hypothetical protein [Bacillota bacterium]
MNNSRLKNLELYKDSTGEQYIIETKNNPSFHFNHGFVAKAYGANNGGLISKSGGYGHGLQMKQANQAAATEHCIQKIEDSIQK